MSDQQPTSPIAKAIQKQLDHLRARTVSFTVAELIQEKDQILGYLGSLVSSAAQLQEQLQMVDAAVEEFHSADLALQDLKKKYEAAHPQGNDGGKKTGDD
jgi:chitinase